MAPKQSKRNSSLAIIIAVHSDDTFVQQVVAQLQEVLEIPLADLGRTLFAEVL